MAAYILLWRQFECDCGCAFARHSKFCHMCGAARMPGDAAVPKRMKQVKHRIALGECYIRGCKKTTRQRLHREHLWLSRMFMLWYVGPALPTGLWTSRLRSSSAHCDLELADESGNAYCDLQLATRKHEANEEEEEEEKEEKEEEVTPSNWAN
eukprot:s629_g13.t1